MPNPIIFEASRLPQSFKPRFEAKIRDHAPKNQNFQKIKKNNTMDSPKDKVRQIKFFQFFSLFIIGTLMQKVTDKMGEKRWPTKRTLLVEFVKSHTLR